MIIKRDDKKQTEIEFNNGLCDENIPIEESELEILKRSTENQEAQDADPHVSLYQIIKEIAKEEGQSFVTDDKITNLEEFDSYRTKQRRYFTKVMEELNLLDKFQTEKGGDYKIPYKNKESIKFLVKSFPQPLNRKVRQGKESRITTKDIDSFIKDVKAKGFLKLTEEDRAKKLDFISSLTQASSQNALKEVIDAIQEMYKKDLGTLTFVSGKNESVRLYNDCDAAYMIYLYEELMQQQSKVWNRIVNLVEDLRNFETSEALADGKELYPFRNIHELLDEALEILREEEKKKTEPKKELPPEQLETIREFIEQTRKNRS